MFKPASDGKLVIYGEGIVHPQFVGSIYMKDPGETQRSADSRFSKAMNLMGFEWLGDVHEEKA